MFLPSSASSMGHTCSSTQCKRQHLEPGDKYIINEEPKWDFKCALLCWLEEGCTGLERLLILTLLQSICAKLGHIFGCCWSKILHSPAAAKSNQNPTPFAITTPHQLHGMMCYLVLAVCLCQVGSHFWPRWSKV